MSQQRQHTASQTVDYRLRDDGLDVCGDKLEQQTPVGGTGQAASAQTLVNIYGSDVTNSPSARANQGFTVILFDLVATSYVEATYPYGATSASGAIYAFRNPARSLQAMR
jgi:hypothetical protein